MWGLHLARTLAADLEDQGIGMCVSIPCRNLRTERVLPDERSSEKLLRRSRMPWDEHRKRDSETRHVCVRSLDGRLRASARLVHLPCAEAVLPMPSR